MDRRQFPANARVASGTLRGQIHGVTFTDGTQCNVAVPVADLLDAPQGRRERQLLLGTAVTMFEDHAGFAFVQAPNGYVGYLASDLLGTASSPTHRVATMATHAYRDDNLKSPELAALPFGVRVTVMDERPKFFETNVGFVPKKHLRPLDLPFSDPATIAQMHFGVPYLWGGDSTRGIDCSGLIAAGLGACNIPCPGDSDLQCAALGHEVTGVLQRGDMIFWRGHVGMMVDADTMVHANGHNMAVTYEAVDMAIARIAAQGEGPVVSRRRL